MTKFLNCFNMEKNQIICLFKTLLALIIAFWSLIMLGLPLFSYGEFALLNGYSFMSIELSDMSALLILAVVILILIVILAIISIALTIANIFLKIKKIEIEKATSAFVIINSISSLLYMIIGITLTIKLNDNSKVLFTSHTYTYLYFAVSIIILVAYFMTKRFINDYYKKIELRNALLHSNSNILTKQTQQSTEVEYISTPTDNTPKAVKMPDINVFDELIKYKELLDENIITQEEFDKMKSRMFKIT